ncbi:hypothetical protein FGO68_gene4680 [Halteria grandinella]|uniref:Uncharacterized protein n=1 Tax=Halteria grandinella TaxID=5974 RepID=A0A8J8NPW1_HALGN|nr:hypothetical protein FGO68_gene4680 [Halteria grandinella]
MQHTDETNLANNSSREFHKKDSVWRKISASLTFISLGKYRTSFYMKGHQDHGTLVGTAVTLVLAIFVMLFAYGIFKGIIEKNNFSVQVHATRHFPQLSVSELRDIILPQITFQSQKDYFTNQTHNEDWNPCGGYKCRVNTSQDYSFEIPCNKTYNMHKMDQFISYQYYFFFDVARANIVPNKYDNKGSLFIQCFCIDEYLCQSNRTDPELNYQIFNGTDGLTLNWNSFYFDMTSQAHNDIRQISYYGSLVLMKRIQYFKYSLNTIIPTTPL